MSGDFLRRWSRRKHGLEPVEDKSPEPAEPGEASLPQEEIAEIAALPSLDSLSADSDFLAFLKKGVPPELRDAALRKAWALDPKIRDFVCEALDYAHDWNVPGGVPGNGPLLPSDDVAGLVERIFGGRFDEPPAPEAEARPYDASRDPEQSDSKSAEGPLTDPMPADDPVRLSEANEPARLLAETEEDAGEEELPAPLPARRHGGARPV